MIDYKAVREVWQIMDDRIEDIAKAICSGGSITDAADYIGVNQKILRNNLMRLGITKQTFLDNGPKEAIRIYKEKRADKIMHKQVMSKQIRSVPTSYCGVISFTCEMCDATATTVNLKDWVYKCTKDGTTYYAHCYTCYKKLKAKLKL